MRLSAFIMAIPFVATAQAQSVARLDAEGAGNEAAFERARELYPRRRDTPLRYINITDGEVREIQRLATGLGFSELLNISAVVTGCACEEGPDCTEQVSIVGKYKERAREIQLSRLRNRWSVGRVQRWWLEYASLEAREARMDRREYAKARALRLAEFPMCPGGTPKSMEGQATVAGVPRPEVKK